MIKGNSYSTRNSICTYDDVHLSDIAQISICKLNYATSFNQFGGDMIVISIGLGAGVSGCGHSDTFLKVTGVLFAVEIGEGCIRGTAGAYAHTSQEHRLLNRQPDLPLTEDIGDALRGQRFWEQRG